MTIEINSENTTNIRYLKVPLVGNCSTFVRKKLDRILSRRVVFSLFKRNSFMNLMFDIIINMSCRVRVPFPFIRQASFQANYQRFLRRFSSVMQQIYNWFSFQNELNNQL